MAQEGSVSKEKMKDGKRNCKTCGLSFPDIYAYTEHLESKDHTKGIMKKKYGGKYLEAKALLSETTAEHDVKGAVKNNPVSADENGHRSADVGCYKKGNCIEQKNARKETMATATNDNIVSTAEDDHKSTDSDLSDDDAEVYTCQECKKICTGIISYKLHLSGKKHLKNVKKNKVLKQMQKEKILPENNDKDDRILDFNDDAETSAGILCRVCNKTCTGPKSFKQHNESEGHKKKLVAQRIMKEMSDQGPNIKEIDSGEDHEQPAYARCDTCSKSFSGPVPYKQHMESTAHFKQTRHLKQMSKLKDLVISSDEHNKIQCKECNKYFSGPLPYQEHMKSTVHEKIRAQNELIKSLQQQNKEMVIRPNLTQMDSDESDNGTVIECTLCHTVFSGPESARDHFQSQKHKKVAKEKKRLAKLKLLRKLKNSKIESGNTKGSLLSDRDDDDDNESIESFEIIG